MVSMEKVKELLGRVGTMDAVARDRNEKGLCDSEGPTGKSNREETRSSKRKPCGRQQQKKGDAGSHVEIWRKPKPSARAVRSIISRGKRSYKFGLCGKR